MYKYIFFFFICSYFKLEVILFVSFSLFVCIHRHDGNVTLPLKLNKFQHRSNILSYTIPLLSFFHFRASRENQVTRSRKKMNTEEIRSWYRSSASKKDDSEKEKKKNREIEGYADEVIEGVRCNFFLFFFLLHLSFLKTLN